MKQHPMLFSPPMVTALVENRKTQTRRIIKFPPDFDGETVYQNGGDGVKYGGANGVGIVNRIYPRWQVGDVIWVKETFYAFGWWEKNGWSKTNKQKWRFVYNPTYHYMYSDNVGHIEKTRGVGWHKRPSLFMPREAARIFLLVTDIGSEQLHDITEADSIAEGVEKWEDGNYKAYGKCAGKYRHARDSYLSLFESLSSKEVVASDPWVTVITFQKLEKPC